MGCASFCLSWLPGERSLYTAEPLIKPLLQARPTRGQCSQTGMSHAVGPPWPPNCHLHPFACQPGPQFLYATAVGKGGPFQVTLPGRPCLAAGLESGPGSLDNNRLSCCYLHISQKHKLGTGSLRAPRELAGRAGFPRPGLCSVTSETLSATQRTPHQGREVAPLAESERGGPCLLHAISIFNSHAWDSDAYGGFFLNKCTLAIKGKPSHPALFVCHEARGSRCTPPASGELSLWVCSACIPGRT